MKLIAVTILFALITQCVNAGELISEKELLDSIHGVKKFGDGRDWFLEKRFGLFVTWGLYSIEGWQEQQQQRLEIPRWEYGKLFSEFDPGNFDPDAWIDLAEKAGMEYITFVAKHMDGFCMWDTEQTDFKVTNSPYGKDILAQLAQACHRRNFPLSIYYCLVDNHHINYPANGTGHGLKHPEQGDKPDLEKYLYYVREQVRELCANYGQIHGFWWDVNQTGHIDTSFNAMIRELQPGIVINNRGFGDGDFSTPEREWHQFINNDLSFDKPVEACNSVGKESWGYRIGEDYHTSEYLMRGISNMLAKGGNYLLNVGPDANGVIPVQAVERLEKIGRWLATVKEAFYGAVPVNELTDNRDILLTRKEDDLFVILLNRPVANGIGLLPFALKPQNAILLNDGSQVQYEVELLPSAHLSGLLQLHLKNLPVSKFCNEIMVIKLEKVFH